MPRVFSPIGFNVIFTHFHSVLNQRFTDTEDVFGMGIIGFRRGLLFTLFSPMRNASAKGLAMQTIYSNNLPTQTIDVMVNPENPQNPDSNNWPLRIIFNGD